jgi:hypothetical protein
MADLVMCSLTCWCLGGIMVCHWLLLAHAWADMPRRSRVTGVGLLAGIGFVAPVGVIAAFVWGG